MSAGEIDVRWAAGAEDLRGAMAVREEVFCREQGVPQEEELDERDAEARHAVAVELAGGRVVGTLRVMIDDDTAKVGRVAVERAWRRRGVASRMLELALADARGRRCTRARLAAQLPAKALYEQAGFAVESGEFEEAGIPHVWMGLSLDDARH